MSKLDGMDGNTLCDVIFGYIDTLALEYRLVISLGTQIAGN